MLRAMLLVTTVSMVIVCSSLANANDWPQFRGPEGNGIVSGATIPLEWDEEQNVRWHVPIAGQGWSAPVVTGSKVIVSTAVSEDPDAATDEEDRPRRGRRRRGEEPRPPDAVHRYEVHCYDLATGSEIWKRVALEAKPRISTHRQNTFASETPVTDGEHVYVYFGMMGLFCFTLDGDPVWDTDLGVYPMTHGWGTASSPTLHDGLLYIQIDSDEDSFLVALDAKTGDEKWRVERDEPSSWSCPIIWHNRERTELVAGGRTVRSYDPKTGDLLWQLNINGGRSSASPAGYQGLMIVGTEDRSSRGQGAGGLFAVKAGASGDITPVANETTSEGVLWSSVRAAPGMASPLLYKGCVYILERRIGVVTCYDADTGEQAYRERLPGAKAFWASPWACDGKVYCQDDTGTTHVLAPGAEFNLLAQNSIDDQFWASSAVADGALILRGVNGLYCIADAP